MTDYFGNEIHIGDIVLYSDCDSHGYCGSFSEGIVNKLKDRHGEVEIIAYDEDGDRFFANKKSENTINLTALGLRPRGDTND